MKTVRLAAALAALIVTGCAAIPEPGDGPPRRDRAVTNTGGVPGPEPRSASGNPRFYDVYGKRYYVMQSAVGYRETGIASWYGKKFHGRLTSSGEVFDMYAISAAHKTLPLPTWVKVTNLTNGRSLQIRVNDRGPFVDDRIIDLSYAAARELGLIEAGTGQVEVSVIDFSTDRSETTAENQAPLYMQVGAFADIANAERMRDTLRASIAEPVFVATGVTGGGATVHRVQIGPIIDITSYTEIERRLRALGYEGSRLISAP
ncbi:MAG: septal ring lytic transglycosylase RlpA family protein [Pseudomonadota bacterium]